MKIEPEFKVMARIQTVRLNCAVPPNLLATKDVMYEMNATVAIAVEMRRNMVRVSMSIFKPKRHSLMRGVCLSTIFTYAF